MRSEDALQRSIDSMAAAVAKLDALVECMSPELSVRKVRTHDYLETTPRAVGTTGLGSGTPSEDRHAADRLHLSGGVGVLGPRTA